MIRLVRGAAAATLIGTIRAYQWIFRPLLAPNCRFVPSCSGYAVEAVRLHGPVRGALLAGWRILRCNPWNIGGYDPVPNREHARVPCCSSHPDAVPIDNESLAGR